MLPRQVILSDLFARSPRYCAIDKHFHIMKKKIIVNRMVLQGPLNKVCGEFCMIFGFSLCRAYRIEDIFKNYSEDPSFNKKALYLQIQKPFSKHFRTKSAK